MIGFNISENGQLFTFKGSVSSIYLTKVINLFRTMAGYGETTHDVIIQLIDENETMCSLIENGTIETKWDGDEKHYIIPRMWAKWFFLKQHEHRYSTNHMLYSTGCKIIDKNGEVKDALLTFKDSKTIDNYFNEKEEEQKHKLTTNTVSNIKEKERK